MFKDNGKPLSGIRVIELGQIAAGPFASSLLADCLLYTSDAADE